MKSKIINFVYPFYSEFMSGDCKGSSALLEDKYQRYSTYGGLPYGADSAYRGEKNIRISFPLPMGT